MPIARQAFTDILENAELAAEKNMPICQDCGLAVVFIEIGQSVSVRDGNIEEAVNEGIRRAYRDGYLRKSVVKDPPEGKTAETTHLLSHTLEGFTGGDVKITAALRAWAAKI